jgi:protein-tyrosine phosphatase
VRWKLQRYSLALIFLGLTSPGYAQALAKDLAPGQSLGIYLNIGSLPNLRDIGGYKTVDGALVVKGKSYRTNAFYPMTSEDLQKIQKLSLKNDYDLRTTQETKGEPDSIPPGVRYTNLNVLADAANAVSAINELEKLLQDPKISTKVLGGVAQVDETFIQMYRELVSLPSAKKSYRSLFLSFADPTTLPNVFHCTNGKDRTGWAAASLLTLLGVPKEQVYEDYLKSNEYLLPLHKKTIDQFVLRGGDKAIPESIFGVKKEYLDAAFDEMHKRYGSIENYFSDALQIDIATQKKIQAIYLQGGQV